MTTQWWRVAGGVVQLYTFFTLSLDGAKWLAAYPNHTMPEKGSLIYILQEAVWAPIKSGHSGEEEISCPCQETNRYFTAVQPVDHSLHRMSYPALCIIVYVWQEEHITLEQPISQLSSTVNLVSSNQWRLLGRTQGGGACKLHSPSNIEIKKTQFL